MSFAGNFADFAGRAGVEVHPVLELVLQYPAQWNGAAIDDLYLSDAATNARGLNYDPRIVTGGWGTITRDFDIRAAGLQGVSTEVTVADTDGQLRALLLVQSQRNSTATIRRVIPNNTDDYATIFVGVLDAWEFKPGQVVLKLKTNEAVLHSFWPAWPYLQSEWFAMLPDFIGSFVPLVYGKHDSSGLSNTGMIPTVPVWWESGATGWYSVLLGTTALVKGVYVNGVLKTATTHYDVVYNAFTGGKFFTVVIFTAGNIPAEDDEVTVDVYGYAETNDGNGYSVPTTDTITNPVRQIRHFLSNFAVDRSKGFGSWSYAATILDSTSWDAAEDWADAHGLEGARYIGGGQKQVLDIFNEWLSSWPAFRAYWNTNGQIALEVLSPDWPGYWDGTSRVLRREDDLDSTLRYELDASDITGRISVSYLYDEVQAKFLRTLTVQDISAAELSDSSYDLYWSASRQA